MTAMTSRVRIGFPAALLSILFVGIYIAPSLQLLRLALHPIGREGWSLTPFKEIGADERLMGAVWSSLPAALGASLVAVSISWLATLSSLWGGRSVARIVPVLLISPLFFPETGHALALSALFVRLGVPQGRLGVSLALLPYCIPFVGIIIAIRVLSIPSTIWRAADDVGLGRLKTVLSIVLPLTWPALFLALLFGFMLCMNEFTRTYYYSAGGMYSTYVAGVLSAGLSETTFAFGALSFMIGVLALGLFFGASRRSG
jgi:spermidine/putrescine transport system permease protein